MADFTNTRLIPVRVVIPEGDVIPVAPSQTVALLSSRYVNLTTAQTVTGQKTFVAPVLGAATATSITVSNGVAVTGLSQFTQTNGPVVAINRTEASPSGNIFVVGYDDGDEISFRVTEDGANVNGILDVGSWITVPAVRLMNGSFYTMLNGSTAGSDKTATFPNATGTVALTTDTAVPLVASFF